jgi:hypothetical protein
MGLGLRPAAVNDPNRTKAVPSDWLFYEPPPPGPVVAPPPGPDRDGKINLTVRTADLHGGGLMRYFQDPDRPEHIEHWKDTSSWVSWDFEAADGNYTLDVIYACDAYSAGGRYALSVGCNRLTATVADTGGWPSYRTERLGAVRLAAGP